MIHDAQDKGRAAFLVGARPTVLAFLEKQGVIKHLADGHSVQKRLEALRMAAETVSQTSLEQAGN